jgi:WD40 repeat protein/tRNA A-37 threonylcarbamoyl transferase component Bud32
MSKSSLGDVDSWSPHLAEQVDETCDRFECAWKASVAASERPRIEDHLGVLAAPERLVLLRELILVDVYYRHLRGEKPQPADYGTRFPDLDPDWLSNAVGNRGASTPKCTLATRPATPPAIPGYEILGLLGRGGMGVIYEARQVGLKRRVALKMIRDQALATAQDLARFGTEAEAVARLQHPNIVHIYDIGEHAGRPFFSLELLTGGSLDRKLAGAPLPAKCAAQLVESLARAVHYAHERGILHRDLKPANVLLTAEGMPKVADFGLAKLTAGGASETQSGTVLGTPSYIAPEQARGQTRDLGPAVDVYSLGAILYETLTGRPPFRAESPLETLRQVQVEEPVAVVRLQPKVPRDLNTICLKCLEKDPRKRYPSAEALADDLGRFLAGEPIRARPAGTWERAVRWARRRPTAAALVAVSVVAFLSLLGGMLWHNAQLGAALYDSRVGEARAIRKTRENGYRPKVFNLLQQANRLKTPNRDPSELRQEAAACLGDFVGLEPTSWGEFPKPPFSAALHPNGTVLALGSGDGTVQLRHIAAGALIARLTGHTAVVTNLAFRADGKELVSVDWTGHIKRWQANDTGRWTCSQTFAFFTGTFTSGVSPPPLARFAASALSPDGRYLAASWINSTIALVEVAGGTTATQFSVPNGEQILILAISPDGKLLAGGYEHEQRFGVLVWDIRTGALQQRLTRELEVIYNLRFSPDSKLLVCTHIEGVALYDTSTFERRPFERGDLPSAVAFSPDSKVLAYQANNDRSIRLWNISMNGYMGTLPCSDAFWVEFSKDGKILVAVTRQQVHTWNLAGTGEKLVLEGHAFAVSSLVFSPDGKLLATSGRDHKIKIWNPVTGLLLKELTEFSTPVEGLSFSPDGRILAAGNYDRGTVRLYDVQSWKALPVMQPCVGGRVLSTAFSADGTYFAVAGSNGLTLWRIEEHPNGPTISFHFVRTLTDEYSSSICFSLDGHWMAWVDGAWSQEIHRVRVWDLGSLQPHALSIARSRGVMKALAFCSNSKQIVFVNDKSAITVWDVSTKQEVSSFGKEQKGNTGLSADGAWYAVGGGQTVAVWDMATKTLLVVLPAQRACSVGWSPNRELLAVGGSDGSLEVWNLSEINARLAKIGLGW